MTDKEIQASDKEMEAQIEQMKCCGNCESVFDDERSNKK